MVELTECSYHLPISIELVCRFDLVDISFRERDTKSRNHTLDVTDCRGSEDGE
jgi:hypothetical protein